MGVYRGVTQDNVTIQGGTLYDVVIDADTLQINGTTVNSTAAELDAECDVSTRLVAATAATLAVTAAAHGGRVVLFDRAGGVTATLPAATGTGNVYRFIVKTTLTSNGIIKVADNTDVMSGALTVTDQAGGGCEQFATAATSDTITLNGTTTGGIAGGLITLVDVATNLWSVSGVTVGTGTEATPFSATV
jgi:hypothetical protein